MSERYWLSELPRFRAMPQIDQLAWLSQLPHLISMFARDTYELGTDGVFELLNRKLVGARCGCR